MLGQMRLGDLQHLGSGQHVEELHRVPRTHALLDRLGSPLCDGVRRLTMHRRLASRGGLGACLVTNILPTLGQPSLLTLQSLGRIGGARCAQGLCNLINLFTEP